MCPVLAVAQVAGGERPRCTFLLPWLTLPAQDSRSVLCTASTLSNLFQRPAHLQFLGSNPRRWKFPRFVEAGAGLVLTRISHGGVQKVHGGPGQAQPVHAIRGLFEVRHHANSRVEASRRIQGAGARRSAGLPPRSPSSSIASGGLAYRKSRHTEMIIQSHPGFLVSEVRTHGMEGGWGGGGQGTHAIELLRAVNSALQRPYPKDLSFFEKVVIASFWAWNGSKTLVGHR